MYVLKGFANHALLANNTPGSTNVIGEISQQSLTYSREVGLYSSVSIAPNIALLSFLSSQDGTAVVVNPDLRDRTMTILEWIYNLVITESGQMFADQFLEAILVQFQGSADTFACGAIVTDGTHYGPEWVSWQDLGVAPGVPNFIKVWFADASFQSQYDEFQILVDPPITPLDDFFKTGSAVETEVNAVTYVQQIASIQNVRAGVPESLIIAQTFNYNDPADPTHLVPTNWTELIYGLAGNNIDSIKDALAAYILANSTHTQAEWTVIFPDIFKRTEFTLVPDYGTYAIEPQTGIQAGIYSPIANLAAANALLTSYATTYPTTHINAHAGNMGHPYKSLSIAMVGSPDNINNWYELSQVFPDLIAVSSTSTDFARMTQATQGFLLILSQLLITAESMGAFTTLPQGITRLTRNNQLYAVASYQNINYLVAAKSNFPTSS